MPAYNTYGFKRVNTVNRGYYAYGPVNTLGERHWYASFTQPIIFHDDWIIVWRGTRPPRRVPV